MNYVEFKVNNHLTNDKLLDSILEYNGITDLAMLNSFTFPYYYTNYEGFVSLIDKHKSITIIGDYDCDGICATSIMYLFLNKLGKKVNYVIGMRSTDGYGLNENLINEAKKTSTLIITVDNGINAYNEVEYAKSLGLDVIVTDHHLISEEAPNCLCYDPHYENIEFKEVCGAFVALSLVYSYFKHKNSVDKEFFESLYELAALATIADVMPLYDINRKIVSNLVSNINYNKLHTKGIKLLCDYLEITKQGPITAMDLSFNLVPILNAAGRLDDATIVVDFFTKNQSTELIDEIIKINNKRKNLTNEACSCLKLENDKINVCFIPDISEGILGIISGKILNQTKKPTFIFTQANDLIKGSGRSLENFDLHSAVSSLDLDFASFGGHKRAVGVTFNDMEEFKKFKALMQNFEVPEPVLYYLKYDFESFSSVYKKLRKLEPIGEGLKVPYFMYKGYVKDIKIINYKHTSFRCEVNGKMEKFIAFNTIIDEGYHTMLFEIKCNAFGEQGQIYKIGKTE